MKAIIPLLLPVVVTAADITTPLAIEVRQRNATASNYAAPNMYADVPPNGAPGLLLYTGNPSNPSQPGKSECVMLGPGINWTPRDPVAGTPGVLNVGVTPGVQAAINDLNTAIAAIPPPVPQVNSDWASASGPSRILNKPVLFSGAYADLSGKPVLFSGSYNDLTGLPVLFSGNYADLAGRPALFSGSYADLSGKPVLFTGAYADLTGKPALFTGAYADLSGKPALGTAASQNTTAFDPAGSSSAAQTFSVQRANHTGVQAQSTITGLVADLAGKEPAIPAGTALQYIAGDKTLKTLPSFTAPARVFSTVSAKTIQTVAAAANGVQLSATRDARVSYSVTTTTTSTIGGASSGYIVLEICPTNSATPASWVEVSRVSNEQTITLAVVLQSVQTSGGPLTATVPAGYYSRIRSVTSSGTVSFTFRSGQEVLE